jgi:hypothetical protein
MLISADIVGYGANGVVAGLTIESVHIEKDSISMGSRKVSVHSAEIFLDFPLNINILDLL